MAENDNTTKAEEQKKPAEGVDASAEQDAESSEGLLDLDSLDEVLKKEDPEFAKSLENIGPDSGIEIYNEALETEYKPEDEEKKWTSGPAFKQKLATALPFLPKLSYKLKMKRMSMRLTLKKWKEQIIKGIWNGGPAKIGRAHV